MTEPAPSILVVDDEPAIRDSVSYALRGEGYDVDEAGDGERALELGRNGMYDVIVLDVMLPRISGTEVCRVLREESDVPILMLTAKDAEVHRVLGLELGADDYVTKPFSMVELVSRVRALLRRRELDRRREDLQVGGLVIDLRRHQVSVDGRIVRLTPSEFKLLVLLAEEPGREYTRREIMQHLWDSEYVGDMRACDVHVVGLRQKIEREPANPTRLLTVRGVGYKLVAV
jgi:two-component system response regulator RegX3